MQSWWCAKARRRMAMNCSRGAARSCLRANGRARSNSSRIFPRIRTARYCAAKFGRAIGRIATAPFESFHSRIRMEYEITQAGPNGEISLIGSHCRDCGGLSFPTRASCSRCFGHDLETVELTRLGRVERFTVVRQAPPGYFGPVPYVLGDVTLEDGVSV